MEVTGKILIAMGYTPGKWFRPVLDHLNAQEDMSMAELKAYVDSQVPQTIAPHETAVPYFKNIRAEQEIESANVASVFETMDELMKTPTIVGGAVMPDACPTGPPGTIPVGGVVVTEDAIHPAMHSADICCSVMMTSFGMVDPKIVLDAAQKITHFGGGGRKENDLFDFPSGLEEKIKANYYVKGKKSIQLAKTHLGTQGDGNHFLYVGRSEQTGETIMVTHHGSRGFGANLYRHGMQAAQKFRREHSPKTMKCNAWLPYSDPQGAEYWEALQLVREWTQLNHTVLHDATARRTGKDPTLRFWNEHNFVFKEGSKFYHAKGATPLDDKFVPDSYKGLRLVPLNMSQPILVVKGETTDTNLGFAPHGAGREISRSQHIRNQEGRTIDEIFAEETAGLDVRFYSGHIDISELPSAYKNADKVQAQMKQFGLGEVADKILPYGCMMAGNWKIDAPWKKKKRKD